MTREKKTPLYAIHVALGAKMVPFAGFSMPVQYSGIRKEHEAVRTAVGLFDVSHMGNVYVSGKDALAFLQRVTVNNVDRLKLMDVQYSALCYPNGTVVDDILVYRLGPELFKLVVNASNVDKDFGWLMEHKQGDVFLQNASADLCILSLQGPKAEAVARAVIPSAEGGDLAGLSVYKAAYAKVNGVADTLLSRTGYTGEDGFEFFPKNQDAPALWNRLMEAGAEHGILPIGLGARDTLRLEAGYSLYGHEISDGINLMEAGLAWITDLTKDDFVGRAALQAKSNGGAERKLVGLELLEQAIPRDGCVVRCEGRDVGVVTSGTLSPTFNKGIAMALVKTPWSKLGTELEVVIRDTGKKARVTGRRFYKREKKSAQS